jgi:peptidoglycan/xylan/chitin deacetylase (PgdA/CDA1 family)
MNLRDQVGRGLRLGTATARALSGRNSRDRSRLDGSCAAILMYHRVLPRADAARDAVEPGMFVSPKTFARHAAWLDERFTVMPLHEIVARLHDGRRLPLGACAITFDDGWRDNLVHALPTLEARGLPATIFVVTDRVGTGGGFWPDEVYRRLAGIDPRQRREVAQQLGMGIPTDSSHAILSYLKDTPEDERPSLLNGIRRNTDDPGADTRELLNWDELDALAGRGVDIEAHGASHAILTGLTLERADQELRSALQVLRERGHARHALFAYPSGAFDSDVVRLAREAGYRAAVTTQVGLASAASDPFSQPRLAVHDDISRTRAEFLRWVPGSARAGVGAER